MGVDIGKVPFSEAINYFRNKRIVTTDRWDQMIGEEHGRAFTVAGATKAALLQDMQNAIADIQKNGGTPNDFRKQFDSIVHRYGWQYEGDRGWRTRIIFETNIRTANAAGRWEQVQRRQAALKKRDPNATLYFEYQTAGDADVRDQHAAWRYILLPVDHPFWDTHYPPNGWGCRCYIRVVSQREVDRRGLEVTKDPEVVFEQIINRTTGEVYPPTPKGINVGFGHHHGKAAYFPNTSKFKDERLGQAVTQYAVDSKDFEKMIAGKLTGIAPIGFLPDNLTDIVHRSIYLSSDTVTKQKTKQPDIKVKQYRLLPDVVAKGLVIENDESHIIFYHHKNKLYRASIQISKHGAHINSYRLAKESEINLARENGQIIKEEL